MPHSINGGTGCYVRTPLDHLPKVLETLEVPADWKLSSVIPFHKEGVREDTGNYNFASLRSVSGKFVEKITLAAVERLKDT